MSIGLLTVKSLLNPQDTKKATEDLSKSGSKGRLKSPPSMMGQFLPKF